MKLTSEGLSFHEPGPLGHRGVQKCTIFTLKQVGPKNSHRPSGNLFKSSPWWWFYFVSRWQGWSDVSPKFPSFCGSRCQLVRREICTAFGRWRKSSYHSLLVIVLRCSERQKVPEGATLPLFSPAMHAVLLLDCWLCCAIAVPCPARLQTYRHIFRGLLPKLSFMAQLWQPSDSPLTLQLPLQTLPFPDSPMAGRSCSITKPLLHTPAQGLCPEQGLHDGGRGTQWVQSRVSG